MIKIFEGRKNNMNVVIKFLGCLLFSTQLFGSASGGLDMYQETVEHGGIPLMPKGVRAVGVGGFDLATVFEAPIYFSDPVQIDGANYVRSGIVYRPGLDVEDLNGVIETEMSIVLYYTKPDADIRDPQNIVFHVTGSIAHDDEEGDEFDSYYALAPFVLNTAVFGYEPEYIVRSAFEELDRLFMDSRNSLRGLFLGLYEAMNGVATNPDYDDAVEEMDGLPPHIDPDEQQYDFDGAVGSPAA
jgi:hypothetical protein